MGSRGSTRLASKPRPPRLPSRRAQLGAPRPGRDCSVVADLSNGQKLAHKTVGEATGREVGMKLKHLFAVVLLIGSMVAHAAVVNF